MIALLACGIAFPFGAVLVFKSIPLNLSNLLDPMPSSEFKNLTGKQASIKLQEFWPEGVTADAVESVSYSHSPTIDSSAIYIRIKANEKAADEWLRFFEFKVTKLEETHQSHAVTETAPLASFTEAAPVWWMPPDQLGTRGHSISVAEPQRALGERCIYTSFTFYDRSTGVLWHSEFSFR